MKKKTIQQGAEAVLTREGDLLFKRRVRKGYRIAEIDDKIRRLRTRSEAKLLEKAANFISVPKVLYVDEKNQEITMKFVNGAKLSESLDYMENWSKVCFEIGRNIAKLHNAGIIHGDLTTSNMIWAEGRLYIIDFGLGFANGRIEDKAVDLHLIRGALEAKHFLRFQDYWKEVIRGYEKTSADAKEVLKRLDKVENRGRYKQYY